MAPYLLEKKLVLAAIGKKQVKIMLKTRANESHNFLFKYNLSDEYARKYIIVKNNIKPIKPVSDSNSNEILCGW